MKQIIHTWIFNWRRTGMLFFRNFIAVWSSISFNVSNYDKRMNYSPIEFCVRFVSLPLTPTAQGGSTTTLSDTIRRCVQYPERRYKTEEFHENLPMLQLLPQLALVCSHFLLKCLEVAVPEKCGHSKRYWTWYIYRCRFFEISTSVEFIMEDFLKCNQYGAQELHQKKNKAKKWPTTALRFFPRQQKICLRFKNFLSLNTNMVKGEG